MYSDSHKKYLSLGEKKDHHRLPFELNCNFLHFFHRYYNHDSTGDDDHTRREVVCKMVTVDNTDTSKCEELMGTQ